jgi:hypothetical protein
VIPEVVPVQRSNGLTADQQAMLRAQMNSLRAECEELHLENANLKRTSGQRRF